MDNVDKDRLWGKIKSHSHGKASSKIFAVDKIFEHFDEYPSSFSLIKEFANKIQPKQVRLRVALKLHTAPLVVKEYFELLKILSENADQDILKIIALRFSTLSRLHTSVPNLPRKTLKDLTKFDATKFLQSSIQQQSKTLQDMTKFDATKFLQSSIQQQSKTLQDMTKFDATKFLPVDRSFKNEIPGSAKLFASILDNNKILTLPIKNELNKSVGFYSEYELESVKSPPELPKKTKASKLLLKLQECNPGRAHWNIYQDICKEILSYCLVPPLLDPIEQSETRDGLHIRDIIFHIPHELQAFWTLSI